MGIRIGAHIVQIGLEKADRFNFLTPELDQIGTTFPTLTQNDAAKFQSVIAKARLEGDSVGGRVECAITGLPAGIGEPMFGGVESRIAQIVYGIPAVKNIGFGLSDSFAIVPGSESNDAYTVEKGRIQTLTNHCGGILGGITNGMPVIFDVTFKPTPSISKQQQSISLSKGEVVPLEVKGRHDPCIVPRAVPVVEAAAAIAIYDLILGNTQTNRRK